MAAEGARSLIAKALAGALLSGEVVDLALVPSGRRLLGHREVSSLCCIGYGVPDEASAASVADCSSWHVMHT